MPASIGRYRILGELGHGGMAVVYLGRVEGPGGFERLAAVKRIHDSLGREQAFLDMFLDEARIAASIHHANVVPVYEIGEDDGRYYIAMDYVDGETLAFALKYTWKCDRPFPIDIAVQLMTTTTEALHAAHELTDQDGNHMKVVHRDVSPQNIMIGYDGIVRVMDFGVAKAVGKLDSTQTGSLKGKTAYMAPEQVTADTVDRRTDVFALGIVLWEMLVGKRLFKADNDFATADKIRNSEIQAPSTFRERIPAELDRIVMRALDREPDKRYQTARELGSDLRTFLAQRSMFVSEPDIEAFMKGLVPDRYTRRQELKRRAREALSVDEQPISEPSLSLSAVQPPDATVSDASLSFAEDVDVHPVNTTDLERPKPSKTLLVLTFVAAAGLVFLVAVLFTLKKERRSVEIDPKVEETKPDLANVTPPPLPEIAEPKTVAASPPDAGTIDAGQKPESVHRLTRKDTKRKKTRRRRKPKKTKTREVLVGADDL